MSRKDEVNKRIIKDAVASLRFEDLYVTEREKKVAMKILNGETSAEEEIKKVINK